VPSGSNGITPEENVRIVVRPFASSLPLGFFSFAIGMLLLGGLANGWLHPSDQHTVGLLLAAFVFPLETIAVVIAFLARDTFGATGLGMFSASWLAFGLADLTTPAGQLSRAVGLMDFGFGFAIIVLAAAAFMGKPLIGTVMSLAAVRVVFAGVHESAGRRRSGLRPAGSESPSSRSRSTAVSHSSSRTCSRGRCCPSFGSARRATRSRETSTSSSAA